MHEAVAKLAWSNNHHEKQKFMLKKLFYCLIIKYIN